MSVVESRQNVAVVFFVGFLVCFFGFLALPIFDGFASTIEIDGSIVGPFFVYAVIIVVLAAVGRSVSFASGLAAGIAAPVTIATAVLSAIGVVLTTIVSDETGGDIPWGGGAAMAVFTAIAGTVAIIVSARAWSGSTPFTLGPVAVFGSIAAFVLVAGFFAPPSGSTLTYSDTLGFRTHPLVGLSVLGFAGLLVGIGVLGFTRGRWGAGLLVGYYGYILLAWLLSRADDPNAFAGFSGLESNATYHPATVIGFWGAIVLTGVHTVQQFADQPTSADTGRSARIEPPAESSTAQPIEKSGSHGASSVERDLRLASDSNQSSEPAGRWVADPFGRFEHRYFDGTRWTNKVANAGVASRDRPEAAPPTDRAPGWHADPFGRFDHRYFNGRRWTEQVSSAGSVNVDAAEFAAPQHETGGERPVASGSLTERTLSDGAGTSNALPLEPESSPALPDDLAETDATVPRSQVRTAQSPPSRRLRLLADGIGEVDLDRPIVIGRAPEPISDRESARLVQLLDATLSKTHALLEYDAEGRIWVTDLHSTNGVEVHGVERVELTPGRKHRLEAGDAVSVGDHTTFRVEDP